MILLDHQLLHQFLVQTRYVRCNTYQSGDLTNSKRAIDGIFGFCQQSPSAISQLSPRRLTPKVSSHCLKGDNNGGGNGGGILVLGEILDQNIVYSPLVPSQPHYNLDLQSIAVNGQLLPIDPAVFATSSTRGTIVDSGTTLAYLVEDAYYPFVTALEIPRQLYNPNMFNAWMVLFLNILERLVPLEGQPSDPEQRKSWGWWKVKKWTVHILNPLYTRLVHNDTSQVGRMCIVKLVVIYKFKKIHYTNLPS